MKKNLWFIVLIVLVFYPVYVYSQVNIAQGAGYDWDELTKEDQAKILNTSKKNVEFINNKEFDLLWESSHSIFKESIPKNNFLQYEKYLSSIACPVDSIKFINGKKVVYSNPTTIGQVVTGGSIDSNDKNYLQFTALPDIADQAIVVYEIPVSPIKKSLIMKYGVENEDYKLTYIEINSCSIGSKDAKYYKDLAEKWKSDEYFFPEFVALYHAFKLSFLGQETRNSDNVQTIEELTTIQNNQLFINEFTKWEIGNESYEIINFDLTETLSDISSTILYISKKQLGEDTTTAEAKILLEYIKEKYPMFKDEFEGIIFQAYEENPISPTQQYKYYRVPFTFSD